jgi:hypothetical protein
MKMKRKKNLKKKSMMRMEIRSLLNRMKTSINMPKLIKEPKQ